MTSEVSVSAELARTGQGAVGEGTTGEGEPSTTAPLQAAVEPDPHWLSQVIVTLKEAPVMLRHKRERLGLSVRAAAKQIGVSFSTVSRIENNEFAEVKSYLAVLRWLRP